MNTICNKLTFYRGNYEKQIVLNLILSLSLFCELTIDEKIFLSVKCNGAQPLIQKESFTLSQPIYNEDM